VAQNDNGPALDVSAVEFEVRYTCTFCKNSPATHLLVSDIVGVTIAGARRQVPRQVHPVGVRDLRHSGHR